MRSSSSAGTLRSSIPSIRAAFSTDECACSEQATAFRPVTWRAAISAASVDVEAVSSMCPCQPSGRPSSCRAQSAAQLELGRRRRGAPEDRDLVQRRRDQLGEDPRLRGGDGEVGEEARVLPVRERRDDQLVEVAEDVRERLAGLGRRDRELRRQLARLDLREHRQLVDALEIAGRPVERRGAVLPEAHGLSSRELVPGARVEDAVARQPRPPRLAEAELRVRERRDLVRVARDRQPQPRLARRPRVDVGEVEPVGLGVDLEEGSRLERLHDHAADVDVARAAAGRSCAPSGGRCSRRAGSPSPRAPARSGCGRRRCGARPSPSRAARAPPRARRPRRRR